jgi:hypothetical protein
MRLGGDADRGGELNGGTAALCSTKQFRKQSTSTDTQRMARAGIAILACPRP